MKPPQKKGILFIETKYKAKAKAKCLVAKAKFKIWL